MPESVILEEANISGLEYLLCSFGCGMCTMYIPETRTDAFGVECVRSLCCCCTADQKFCMLPKDPRGYEIVLIRSGQVKCIDPPVLRGGALCKGVSRNFCTIAKFAFPCDEDVPFALAGCGVKCAERSHTTGEIHWCKDDTPIDPHTGLRPLFPALSKREPGPSFVPEATVGGSPASDKMERK